MTSSTMHHQHLKTERLSMPSNIARFNMIEQQIRTWEVLDPAVLALLDVVPVSYTHLDVYKRQD